jgi:hypothetical protein
LANAVNHEIAIRSRVGSAPSLGLLIGLILFSFPAAAQVYPVSGVWAAIDSQFPAAANETCIAVKTFGVEAVSKKSISEMIIFGKDKRYDVKGDVQTETTIKSIKVADGGFRITESFSKRRGWLGFKRKTTYVLKICRPCRLRRQTPRQLCRDVNGCAAARAFDRRGRCRLAANIARTTGPVGRLNTVSRDMISAIVLG